MVVLEKGVSEATLISERQVKEVEESSILDLPGCENISSSHISGVLNTGAKKPSIRLR